MKRPLITIIGSFLYTGFFPFAPATFASLVWLLVWLYVPGGRWMSHPIALALTLPVSVWVSGVMEGYYGEDAPAIVIDEFVGMQVTFLFAAPSLSTGIAGFLLFRVFDIVKPFPAGRSQRLPGGIGVVTDDLLAGLYSLAALSLLIRFTGLS